MISVTFYRFAKRDNSTKQPSSGGTSFNVMLKEQCGIVRPVLLLDIGLSSVPNWNYCYIPSFGRYYWIDEIVNVNALWHVHCHVDSLASWKSEIGGTNLYVLRASADFDGSIMDSKYPANTSCTTTIKNAGQMFSSLTTDDYHPPVYGSFVCGITSQDATIGGMAYYAIESGTFKTLCENLMTDQFFTDNGFSIKDATLALQKSLVNPISYIRNCVFIPVGYGSIVGDAGQSIYVGSWNSGVTGKRLSSYTPYTVFTKTISVDNHPQISRGRYLNFPPYSVYWLVAPPFGTIQIDGTLLRDSANIKLKAIIDHFTGQATLYVMNNDDVVINVLSAQAGVPINMSQVSRDYLGGVSNTVQSIAGTIGSALDGNIGGAIASGTGILNATASFIPRVQSTGSQGSFSGLYGCVRLYEQFFTVSDEDNGHFGRPLCQVKKPSALGGFMIVADGDISAPATSGELSEIKSYLESGFYYE